MPVNKVLKAPPPPITLPLLLLAFALRLYHLDVQSLWWDEGHSLQMASAPLTQIPTLPGMDVHPPGYFGLLHGWMTLAGQSEFALRFLSLAFSLLTVALLIRFAADLTRRTDRWRTALWVGGLATLSPLYVAYAQEVRMYAQVTFFATASTYLLWRVTNHQPAQPPSRLALAGYSLTLAATLYSHYFGAFLVLVHGLWWLGWLALHRRVPTLKTALAGLGGAGLLFLPQAGLAIRQVSDYANPNLAPPTLTAYLSQLWQAYTLGLTIEPPTAQPWLIVLLIVVALGGAALRKQPALLLLLGWVVVPVMTYFAILQARPSFEPRYLMLVSPPLILLLGHAPSLLRRSGWLIGLASLIALSVGLHSYFTNPTYFKDDATAAVQWLAAETTPNDVVLVDVPHPFHYYAERIPAETRYFFVDVHTAAQQLNQVAGGKNRLFWLTWWGSDTDPRGVVDFLAQKQSGQPPQGRQDFRGYRIEWYTLSERPFSLPTNLPPADVNFDQQLKLTGLAHSQNLSPGETAWATLRFEQLSEMSVNYKISLRLRTPDGAVLAQSDKFILNDRHFQTAAWPLSDPALNQAINVYLLPLSDPSYTGPLTLEAVVYNADTLAAIAAYGVPTTNDDFVSAQLGTVSVGR